MADIMNADWDKPVDEGTVGTVAKIGALAGVGGGIYEGIKRHKIDARRRDERQLRISRLLNGVRQDSAEREEHRKTMAEKRREYAEKKLDRKIRDTESDLDEGVGKTLGLATLGYTTYQMTKEPVAELVRDALNAKDKAAREHEYAFRETPKDTVKRIKRKIQHESAAIMSKVW